LDGASRRAVPGGLDRIVYTRTRTIALDSRRLRQRRVIVDDSSPAADAYRILATGVLQQMQPHGWNTLAITSPGASEGKTLTAINLALALAMGVDRTVLLVDADLRAPRLRSVLGIPEGPGLRDFLMSNAPLDRVLVHLGIGRLVVLPGSSPAPNAPELLASSRMDRLVQELKTRYPSRYVLFDLAPLLDAADAMAFAPLVDSLLLVVEDSKTRREDVARAVELLRPHPVLGSVLNKVVTDERSHRKLA
jgi:capsular exopolysaccharide synthesis family protein